MSYRGDPLCRGDIGEIHGRYTGDIREIYGRYTGDIREIYGRVSCRGDPASTMRTLFSIRLGFTPAVARSAAARSASAAASAATRSVAPTSATDSALDSALASTPSTWFGFRA